MSKTRIITLTDARPIQIQEDDWPIIAVAKWHDGQVESQANRTRSIRVREHADGRRIVYGTFHSHFVSERDISAGYLLTATLNAETVHDTVDDATIDAIRRVADAISDPLLGDDCVADLPPREI